MSREFFGRLVTDSNGEAVFEFVPGGRQPIGVKHFVAVAGDLESDVLNVEVEDLVPGSIVLRVVFEFDDNGPYDDDPYEYLSLFHFALAYPFGGKPRSLGYSSFVDGEYSLYNVEPGEYSFYCSNYDIIPGGQLVDDSILTTSFVVDEDTSVSAVLFLHYESVHESEPEPEEDSFIDIPVNIIWDDNNDQEGARPASVTVNLFADNVELGAVSVTAAMDWSYTFNMPEYVDGCTVNYTVTGSSVDNYGISVNGYNITYTRVFSLVSKTVSVVWDDRNNADGVRPASVAMRLVDGDGNTVTTVILNDNNAWTGIANNLSAVVNGESVTYSWLAADLLGYAVSNQVINGNVTTFTYSILGRPEEPPEQPGKPPKTPL